LWEVLQHLPHGPDPVFSNFSFFCSFQKCFWCESDEFGSVHFMWIFANYFAVLAPAGAHAPAEALIMLKSSVHSCVCVLIKFGHSMNTFGKF
jgi:hypothetical protein